MPSGKTCPTTRAAGLISPLSPTNRVVLSWDGSKGIPFRFPSLKSTQQATIDLGDATPYNANRVDYLRGVRTNEVTASGTGLFRARTSVLGDIVDSSPTWVGPPAFPYTAAWKDRLYGSSSAAENSGTQNYQQFVTSAQTRTNVVYVGSNDGLLHGFRTGAYDADGKYDTSAANDGVEILAYMPAAVVNTIHNDADPTLDYADTQYGHNFFVDATPGTGDLFYSGKWHTWLVGGLGPGGPGLYALDVTTPTAANYTESNAQNLVIGDWTPATVACVNVGSCGKNLGNTYGVPVIRRLHNGKWAVLFGNGLSSNTGDAGLFIMTVEPSSGSTQFYYLSTGKAGTSNGISYVTSADLDGDHVTDYVYGGDLLGNVWRFDLTSSNPASWAAGAAPLFTTPSGQPITTRLVVASGPSVVGAQQLIIAFGRGRERPSPTARPSPTRPARRACTESGIGIWRRGTQFRRPSMQVCPTRRPASPRLIRSSRRIC